MKKTPLHSEHLALNARMGGFGGWDMPIQYVGILQEHEHTRTNASIFDICHMGEFELVGSTAAADLEKLLTMNIASLAMGQCRYGFLLNDDGGVIDDLTCYRLGEERYMLVVNAGTCPADAEWIRARLSPGTRFTDLSPNMAKLDVQGPQSRRALEEAFGQSLPELGYFKATEIRLMETDCILSRTGYTGEWGYEIYLPNESVVAFWQKILSHELVEPGGLGARDTLRLEMGYPLYGHELSAERTPVPVSRGAFIHLAKEFIGKENVEADLADPEALLVGLQLPGKRAAREHDKIYFNEIEVGEVTSGSLAPSLGYAVAMAFVEPDFAEEGRELEIEIRGKKHPATVVSLPFYKSGTARG